MRKRLLVVPLILVVGFVVLLVTQHHEVSAERWEPVRVIRTDAIAWLRETGTLSPRDPLVVPAPFDGKLQWVVEDSTWVTKGEPLFIINDADELKKVAEERQQLEESRQDRELAELKLVQSIETEARKVQKTHDDLVLEQARNRILTEPALGGLTLVRLDQELRPLADQTAVVRAHNDKLRASWQRAQDVFLERLTAWQQHQDALLRLENKLDELAAREREERDRPADAARRKSRDAATSGAKEPDKSLNSNDKSTASPAKNRKEGQQKEPATVSEPQADAEPNSDPAHERELILAERAALTARTAALHAELELGRGARDETIAPRDLAQAALKKAEDAERELRIRIEIEKRRLPATQLELDVKLAEITAVEADRRLAEGTAAWTSQVISQAALDDLTAIADQARTALTTTRERMALAARPPGPEVLGEAAARLAKATQSAAQAEEVRTRNLEIQRQNMAVLDAKIARLTASLALRAGRFPSTIEQEIVARERSRTLHPENAHQLDAELAELKSTLVLARAHPPNVLIAAVSGLVKVRREGERQKLAGDQVYQADPLCEVYPPENMEVVVRVNEVNVPKLRHGMKVRAEIPALGKLPRSGVISQVAGVGRDKNEFLGRHGHAGVTQYEVRIVLAAGTDGRDGDFRQGMTTLVEIELERQSNVLVVPRVAVEQLQPSDPAGTSEPGLPTTWKVHRAADERLTPISGQVVGDDVFVITAGLQEGDHVYVRRIANR